MGQILRVGTAQAYTTLASAVTALGNINGTGANEILIDAGYAINEDFSATGVNSGINPADTLSISGDGGYFIFTPQSASITLNSNGVSFKNVTILSSLSAPVISAQKDGTGVEFFEIIGTGGGYALLGSNGKLNFARDGVISGTMNYAARYLDEVSRVTAYGTNYGIRDGGTITDCLTFSILYSTDYTSNTSLVNCASEDGSGSAGLTNTVGADTFVDAAGGDFRLKPTSNLVGAGVNGGNIGYDQVTGSAPSSSVASIAITEAPDTISISAETSNPSAVSITINEQADGVLISASVGGAPVAPSVLGSQLTRGVSFDIDMGTAYTAGASTDYVEVWIVGVDGSEVQCTVTANTDGMISATPPTVTGKIEVRPITILAN